MIETLDDIVEYFANREGIYGAHSDDEANPCRCCWTSDLKSRILSAVEIEELLSRR